MPRLGATSLWGERRRGVRAILAALIAAAALAATGAAPAMAAPTLVIESPANGSWTKSTAPAISGTSTDTVDQVTVVIHEGKTAEGPTAQTLSATPSLTDGSWTVTPSALGDGPYTAVAEQTQLVVEHGSSEPVTFIVDTALPAVTLNAVPSPTNDSTPTLDGAVGTAR